VERSVKQELQEFGQHSKKVGDLDALVEAYGDQSEITVTDNSEPLLKCKYYSRPFTPIRSKSCENSISSLIPFFDPSFPPSRTTQTQDLPLLYLSTRCRNPRLQSSSSWANVEFRSPEGFRLSHAPPFRDERVRDLWTSQRTEDERGDVVR